MTTPDRLAAALADRYRIERELGQGGMATVYLAEDIKHRRKVAIKVLKPELGAVLGAERFLAEIRVTASLQHPNLLPLFDSGDADGLLYYVMPHVEGETLRARLERERQLPVDETVRVVGLLAQALDYAHARGVIHRDLKPENILLQAGQPMIADFGIALAVAQAGGSRITETGLSLGTPQYMSPEQATGDRVLDARADEYALAAVTYEMLTGEPPHTGPTAQAIIARVLTEKPRSVRATRASVPVAMDLAIQRALSKAPADRFPTCGEFAQRLAAADATGAVRSWDGWVPAAAIAVLIAGLGYFGFRFFDHRGAVGGPAAGVNSVAVLYLDNLSRDSGDAFLADGLTEEIIIRLGKVPRLAVKSLFEVQRFKGQTSHDPAALGRSLDAAYIVTGSVQRVGGRVRLRVELIRSATQAQVWGDVFDRASSDLLTVESDIAEAVATAITGQLLPAERTALARPVTSDPVAYEQYLRGLQAAHNFGDEAALRGAVGYFDRAIARDSGFASAYAGKAVAWSMLADGYVTPREGYGQTRVAANRALALDSSQALGYAMLSNAVLALDLDAHEAERLARRGIALDPHGGWSRLFLSGALWAEGRTDEAIAAARRAWLDDSLFTIMSVNYVSILVNTGHLDSAAAMVPRIRAILSPTDADPLEGMLLAARGEWRQAVHLLGWRYYGGYDAGAYVRALLALGDTVAARATVDSMLAARTPGYYNPIALARAYAALGNIDKGMEWLKRAFDERTAFAVWARQDPGLARLRADPRYAALDRQLRF